VCVGAFVCTCDICVSVIKCAFVCVCVCVCVRARMCILWSRSRCLHAYLSSDIFVMSHPWRTTEGENSQFFCRLVKRHKIFFLGVCVRSSNSKQKLAVCLVRSFCTYINDALYYSLCWGPGCGIEGNSKLKCVQSYYQDNVSLSSFGIKHIFNYGSRRATETYGFLVFWCLTWLLSFHITQRFTDPNRTLVSQHEPIGWELQKEARQPG